MIGDDLSGSVRGSGIEPPRPQTMEVVLLGTAGGPIPFARRGAPAQAIVHGKDLYVVDCGNGVARQMVRAGLSLADLRAIFLTHHHADHMLDIGALPFLAWADGLSTPVDLIGPPPLRCVLNHFLAMIDVDLRSRQCTTGRPRFDSLLRVREIEGAGVVWDHNGLQVRCCIVDHPPLRCALAFRFQTADRCVVISGDTRYSSELVELARGADVLVHEAYHGETLDQVSSTSNARTLREHIIACHTEVHEVSKVAHHAGVGLLVLSHLVPADGAIDDETWVAAATSEFDGPVVVGRDFQTI